MRIIAATNEDLPTAIAGKRFRADLYQRLKEYTLHIPPLRECKEDIMPLADFFRQLANEEFEKQIKGFDAEARKRLLAYTWGGNVRELKRVVHLAMDYNTSVYQRSNEATKEWCNKQKRIGIHTLACKPARAPTGLPSSLPADRSAGVPACRHTDRQTYQQAIRKSYSHSSWWLSYR